ncbi:cholecystokinin receptor-like [Cydia pomonella]|uniref:cholecystokinin receptor-like n=1 Tax=Cydia pomonella TaxID=82600 RepID=UPI002ADE51C1|nr:cholecystokinin receptor-like [Cydia pomonella]
MESTSLTYSHLYELPTATTALDLARNDTGNATRNAPGNAYEWRFILPPYVLIFMLSISGNCLVIATLAYNKTMRTVTNVFLLNLAISDFMLGVFCVPFTLIGQIYRRFLFGPVLCKIIPFFQAVSVSVDVWTLVAISLERYFAICRPLKSRKWQTQSHAYKMIALVWLLSLVLNFPILIVSTLQPMRETAYYKCREVWPNLELERAFSLGLDVALLIIPIFVMVFAYSLIVTKLWRGMQHEIKHNYRWQRQRKYRALFCVLSSFLYPCFFLVSLEDQRRKPESLSDKLTDRDTGSNSTETCCKNGPDEKKSTKICHLPSLFCWILHLRFVFQLELQLIRIPDNYAYFQDSNTNLVKESTLDTSTTDLDFRHAVRSTHTEKSIEAKRKVIRMLFVIILEFFICWTPLHVINTIYLYYPQELYNNIGSKGITSLQLLAFCSSFSNPITYCFMNRRFRQAFICLIKNCRLFKNCFDKKPECKQATPPPSSQEQVTACVVRGGSHTARSGIYNIPYLRVGRRV